MATMDSQRMFVLRAGRTSLFTLSLLTAVTGCSWLGSDSGVEVGPLLGELEPVELPAAAMPIAKVSLDEVERNYYKVLEVTDDPAIRQKVRVRLAALEMNRAEQNMLDATEVNASGTSDYFNGAIELYEGLLAEANNNAAPTAQDSELRDVLLYQLAKAHSLDGKVEQSAQVLDTISQQNPNSLFIAEAEFRRAERAFSYQQYELAQSRYAAVIAVGEGTPFYQNAIYMRGWAQFKQNKLRASLSSFTQVLDLLAKESPQLDTVEGAQKNLLGDTLHVMSLVFSYMSGAQSIADTYTDLGDRLYVHLLYRQLGELYLTKERYRDSADTYLKFIEQYPLSEYSPMFNVSVIDVYQQGQFPSLILPAKEAFARGYGIHSPYWEQASPSTRETLLVHLKVYLKELAQYQHALAQTQQTQEQKANQKTGKQKPSATANEPAILAVDRFRLAALWYQEFIDTFPADPDSVNMRFLLAEARFDAGDYPGAYQAYSHVAYISALAPEGDRERGAQAGYSAILAVDQHLLTLVDEVERGQWQQTKIDSAFQYADYYYDDPRSSAVLTQVAQLLLSTGQPEQAIVAAQRITQWQPAVEKSLLLSAWLVMGQGQFDLLAYAGAESAYREVLALLPRDDSRRTSVIDRIAASMYKNAEQLAASDASASIAQLLSIRDVAPGTDIAINAQYDAINQLMAANRWPKAQAEVLDFRRRYPRHGLTGSLAAKLVVIYESQQQWAAAATELNAISRTSDDVAVRRDSLYLAAQYFEKAGNTDKAIEYYREYAHTYAEPFPQVMEARFKMSELYLVTDEPSKRKFWLKKLIDGDANAGTLRDDRSRYLGAFASAAIAQESYDAFATIPLKLPLKTSLKKKHKALKKALAAYEGVASYGVSEFTTLSTYQIGEIYGQLSRDLLASQRPKNLDADSLEQYDILLEEQAYPFEEQSIEIHQNNAQRSWQGLYDQWVKSSFEALAKLVPGRYAKREHILEFSDEIR